MQNKALFKFDHIKLLFEKQSPISLPGHSAQYLMAPMGREKMPIYEDQIKNFKESAVMIFIGRNANNDAIIYLIKRKVYAGVHSGQISFPGGKKELTDLTHSETATRESFEEIGITKDTYTIVHPLSALYIPVSQYIVYPFIAIIHNTPKFHLDQREVDTLLAVELNWLFDPKNKKEKEMDLSNDKKMVVPYYDIQGEVLWGATAMMMSEFIEMLSYMLNISGNKFNEH